MARLSRIIDALLRLSRAGRVEYHPKTLSMNDLVRRVADALHCTATEKGATVIVGDLPAAWGDPTAVDQVFANLVGNALNYLDPARPGRVEVGGRAGAEGPDGADPGANTYWVTDNGLGISADHLPKLFQPFHRLHADRAPGEGIGLAIIRRILSRVGGTVRAESASGAGSTFFVTLPAGRSGRPDSGREDAQ